MDRRHLDGAVPGAQPAAPARLRSRRPDESLLQLVSARLPQQHRPLFRYRQHRAPGAGALSRWRPRLQRQRRSARGRQWIPDAVGAGGDVLRASPRRAGRACRRQLAHHPCRRRSAGRLPVVRGPGAGRLARRNARAGAAYVVRRNGLPGGACPGRARPRRGAGSAGSRHRLRGRRAVGRTVVLRHHRHIRRCSAARGQPGRRCRHHRGDLRPARWRVLRCPGHSRRLARTRAGGSRDHGPVRPVARRGAGGLRHRSPRSCHAICCMRQMTQSAMRLRGLGGCASRSQVLIAGLLLHVRAAMAPWRCAGVQGGEQAAQGRRPGVHPQAGGVTVRGGCAAAALILRVCLLSGRCRSAVVPCIGR
ncbi:hypothetical protein XAP412_870019 [Xanthomonas phaseoli pv. phaseoli]|uniref:Uncharacterized protein n=1 Tax=Xanthomonas campestris pv. phaseoli TaxID=317013 RepID=A0AB38E666_XANCH|nr:hypothetical protein XAP6984_900019 [Xanthomonas phaseoli pv. phaseoli]SON91161.1 hypothetical protein XAP412_870019 [Xanthomonas phaseoli pv. phaseoli]SON92818.1 hypothetical protein XAP7430_890018 [Xanthomonas phaseoli pv. phaseoli]SOO29785.1 hypothetical protein XAP6164_3640009 [Xanthomonas phaseoli pv. phaseoli]